MTKEGILQVLSVLKLNYPASFREMTQQDRQALYSLWAFQFADFDDATVKRAIQSLISTSQSEYAPPIGKVKAEIVKLTGDYSMTEQEAWNLVKKAIRNCDMLDPSKEYDKLPDDIKALVGSSGTLLEWACMDTGELHTVVASNFQRSYRTKKNREKEYAAIPKSVKKAIEGAKNGLESRYGLEDRGALQIEA